MCFTTQATDVEEFCLRSILQLAMVWIILQLLGTSVNKPAVNLLKDRTIWFWTLPVPVESWSSSEMAHGVFCFICVPPSSLSWLWIANLPFVSSRKLLACSMFILFCFVYLWPEYLSTIEFSKGFPPSRTLNFSEPCPNLFPLNAEEWSVNSLLCCRASHPSVIWGCSKKIPFLFRS